MSIKKCKSMRETDVNLRDGMREGSETPNEENSKYLIERIVSKIRTSIKKQTQLNGIHCRDIDSRDAFPSI